MVELVASDTTVLIVFSAVTALTLALTTLFVAWIFLAVFEGGEESVRNVQRFIELTDEARALLPSGLPLFDPDGGRPRPAPPSLTFRRRRTRRARRSGNR